MDLVNGWKWDYPIDWEIVHFHRGFCNIQYWPYPIYVYVYIYIYVYVCIYIYIRVYRYTSHISIYPGSPWHMWIEPNSSNKAMDAMTHRNRWCTYGNSVMIFQFAMLNNLSGKYQGQLIIRGSYTFQLLLGLNHFRTCDDQFDDHHFSWNPNDWYLIPNNFALIKITKCLILQIPNVY